MQIDWKKLSAPFPAEDIEWRVQQSGVKNGKGWALVLAYVTNRAIQQRLDDVVSPANWKNEYSKAPDDGVLCGISIRVKGDTVTGGGGDEAIQYNAEWVTKFDGAENTQVEAVKGGLSGAMKRAAVQWGVGRYLYQLESNFVSVEDNGDNYINIKYQETKGGADKYLKGYWSAPKLPEWALPAKPEAAAPSKQEPVPAPSEPEKPKLISQAQFAELMQIAKMKGHTDKAKAIAFLKEATGLADPTTVPADDFDMYKKRVTTAGWTNAA
ncbi:UNVERIFIED_ORG: hypothetical protein ABID57_000672 [Arthrobacter sp. UYEF1]